MRQILASWCPQQTTGLSNKTSARMRELTTTELGANSHNLAVVFWITLYARRTKFMSLITCIILTMQFSLAHCQLFPVLKISDKGACFSTQYVRTFSYNK